MQELTLLPLLTFYYFSYFKMRIKWYWLVFIISFLFDFFLTYSFILPENEVNLILRSLMLNGRNIIAFSQYYIIALLSFYGIYSFFIKDHKKYAKKLLVSMIVMSNFLNIWNIVHIFLI